MTMRVQAFAILGAVVIALSGCDAAVSDRPESVAEFPPPDRSLPNDANGEIDPFPDEDAREERGEAQAVMDLANISEGMTVADIGAGEGYYTVRLGTRVGEGGRVLAQDIDRDALERLGRRVERERLENISIKLGDSDDPRLPTDSFDRIFLVHVYSEVTEPYAFMWKMWPALSQGGQIIVVEYDRPTNAGGIPPKLLFCELDAVGYKLVEFVERPDLTSYFARFERGDARMEPDQIAACPNP
ncbi:MAG: class I SAM-dependent methyltransferase [Pseudomonadota bacterium]